LPRQASNIMSKNLMQYNQSHMAGSRGSFFETIKEANKFFLRQALYPLALASFLCIAIYVTRVAYTYRFLEYRNLVWNLVLAWIPYLASMMAAALNISFPRLGLILLPIPGIVWLLFFPNAPYLVTDFLHLQSRPPVPLWYDIGLVSSFAFTGYLLAVISLHTMHTIIEEKLGWLIGWIFAFVTLPLCGFGIYLGRFGRFNSWDFISNPKELLEEISRPFVDPFDNLRSIGFTLMFTAILFVFYLTFTALSNRKHAQ
jgi:uncharacterized membrane protein